MTPPQDVAVSRWLRERKCQRNLEVGRRQRRLQLRFHGSVSLQQSHVLTVWTECRGDEQEIPLNGVKTISRRHREDDGGTTRLV